jgi:hypothetical protein
MASMLSSRLAALAPDPTGMDNALLGINASTVLRIPNPPEHFPQLHRAIGQ